MWVQTHGWRLFGRYNFEIISHQQPNNCVGGPNDRVGGIRPVAACTLELPATYLTSHRSDFWLLLYTVS